MDVLVLGTGALGCTLAAHLARAARVTVAGTWPEALEAISRDGVSVEEDGARWRAAVRAVHANAAPTADVVLVAVKSWQTATVAPVAARARGAIVSLQNGLGHQAALGDAVLGVTTLGATVLSPGAVRVHPGPTVVGEGGEAAATLMAQAGLPTTVRADIAPVLWRKLAVNCAINPLTALMRVPNGVLLEDEGTRGRLMGAALEVAAVALAAGVPLAENAAEAALAVARQTARNRSSMLQDVERGARTEIDDLCGFVVGEGRRRGVRTPVNDELWRAVSALVPARQEA